MKNYLMILFILLAFIVQADDDPHKVLVVYNTDYPDNNGNGIGDSEEAADYYVYKRDIPTSNVLAVSTSTNWYYYQETGRIDFLENLVNPIIAKIDSIEESGGEIYYILLSYGFPEKYVCVGLENSNRGVDNCLCVLENLAPLDSTTFPRYWYNNNSYFEDSPTVDADEGHFDGSSSFMGNPIRLVTRLDGISVERSMELVERSLYAEKYLLPDEGYYSGTMYLDYRYGPYDDFSDYSYGYGSYALADHCMAKGRDFFETSGWTFQEEPYDHEIGESSAEYMDGTPATSAPNAIGYEGWYNYNTYHDAWDWKVGAWACDLNSNSGSRIRRGTTAFLPCAFRLGLTCGVGVIAEPYLTGHARPEVFAYYMLNGFNFAEASYLAQPSFKWMGIHIGDPIYNPHKEKTAVYDDTPPPMPEITIDWINDTLWFDILINTYDREPDLIKTRIIHGLLGETERDTSDYDRVFAIRERIALTSYTFGDNIELSIDVIDPVGNNTTLPTYAWTVGDEGILGIDELDLIPKPVFAVDIYPNPFNSSTVVSSDNEFSLTVYDCNGKRVHQKDHSCKNFTWQPDDKLPSGLYLMYCRFENHIVQQNVLYLK